MTQTTTTTHARSPFGLDDSARDDVAQVLQSNLLQLIDLALATKQAHWNLRGAQFQAIHEQLDAVVDDVRVHVDDVAERITTLNVPADGRSQIVAKGTELPIFPEGRPRALVAAKEIADRIELVAQALRTGLPKLADLDPISEDLAIAVTASLEKHQWMLRSIVESEDV